VVGEDEGPSLPQAVVREELRPPAAEVTLPFVVVLDLDDVRRLATAALLHDGAHQPLPLHRLDKLERQRKEFLAPRRYDSNVSIIFDAPCLFYTNCFVFCLHLVAFLCFFQN
jgi:hypothetical protein